MAKKRLGQDGLSLVELLAALVIASLLIVLISSVLTSTLKFNNRTQDIIDLRQESNKIITQIRNLHRNNGEICYSNLIDNGDVSMKLTLDHINIEKNSCLQAVSTNDLAVVFTLFNGSDKDYTLSTVVEGRERTPISIVIPDKKEDEDFYDKLDLHDVFVYGSNLFISGSSPLNSAPNGSGSVVVTNLNKKNLDFVGDNRISVQKIYIDKPGNAVIFKSSTHLGEAKKTELVTINGNVILDNGGAKIYGDTIYINGDVTFSDSSVIEGKKVIITGNVVFKNWSAVIKANEIYISGVVKNETSNTLNIVGTLKDYKSLKKDQIPEHPSISIPTFREDSWYPKNGYETRTNGNLSNGNRIYSPGNFKLDNWQSNKTNVVIISKGDIELNNFGGSELTGILFAPQGKVTFKGGAFKGIVITRDGFSTGSNPSITYMNVKEFIKENDPIPFQ